MKNLLLVGLAVLFVALFMVGCGETPLTIGPAQLTITNGTTLAAIQEASFNGTTFGSISVGSSVTQSITSGNYYLYIQMLGIWMRVDPSLRINAGDNASFTVLDTTVVAIVTGPSGSIIKSSNIQNLKDLLNSTK